MRYQETILNQALEMYKSVGGTVPDSKNTAVAVLTQSAAVAGSSVLFGPVAIQPPPDQFVVGSDTYTLTFADDKFSYTIADVTEGAAPTPAPTPVTVPLVLDVKMSGGTATYGGQELPGVGAIPSFMLAGTGSGFQLHNSGGYDSIGTWYNLGAFLSGLPTSPDRFNPVATRTLILQKNGTSYYLSFALWNDGNRLRLITIGMDVQ